jgi:hypothetical protein
LRPSFSPILLLSLFEQEPKMTALTADRSTRTVLGDFFELPLAASTLIFAGSLTAVNAAGYATKGAVSTTLKQFGRADERVDNSAGANGAKTIRIATGIFRWANSAAGDLIANSEIGLDCYIVDDQTVAKTTGGGTRSRAGKVAFVDASGVYVQMGPQF